MQQQPEKSAPPPGYDYHNAQPPSSHYPQQAGPPMGYQPQRSDPLPAPVSNYHHTTIVTTQPAQFTNGVRPPNFPYREWSSDLCSCCDDMESCCLTYLLGGFYLCCLYSRYDECACAPMCMPMPITALRLKHRHRHGIHGSIFNDFCVSVWCGLCAICQLKRDMDFVERSGQHL